MGDFFTSFYDLFVGRVIGHDLLSYISGQMSPAQDANYFVLFGCIMLITTILSWALYYFVLDRHSFCHWWCWLSAMLIPGIINLLVGWISLKNQFDNGLMIDADGNSLGFTVGDCFNFGFANFLMVLIVFIVLTIIAKVLFKTNLLQSDCSSSPF